MLTNILQQHGFSSIEARVYLTTLELGFSPVSKIAHKMNENRVTIYSVLENLEKKGLIQSVVSNKIKQYSAIDPKALQAKIQEKTDAFIASMPELLALSASSGGKPSVALYEGLEGIKLLYQDTISEPNSEIKAFLGYGEIDPTLQRYLNFEHLNQRIKHHVQVKILIPGLLKKQKGYNPQDFKGQESKLTEIRYVENSDFSLYNEIDLYGGNKIAVMLFGTEEMMGLLIQSEHLYKTLSALFDLTWERETNDKHTK